MKQETKSNEEIVEEFANQEHERWGKWQRYMHSKMIIADMPDGERFAMLPIELFERWERQIKTPYSELSEEEKESDREQVYPYIRTFDQLLAEREVEVREDIKKEITEQTLLNDGDDTFVHLGQALWVCDSEEDREKFEKALSTNTPKV